MHTRKNEGPPAEPVNTGNHDAAAPRAWIRPEIHDLPRLSDLTLQSGGGEIPGGGGTGGGGSTVVP